jgi:KDO2-lipid IV(A) lauroyltransferase
MRESIEFIAFLLLNRISRSLPFRVAGRIGAFLGEATFLLTGFRKRVTLENISRAFPELSPRQISVIARGAYKNYGIALLEMLWAGSQTPQVLASVVQISNPEVMMNALSRGKGVIFLSGHFGSWELLISAVRLQLGRPFAIVVQHQRNRRIDALLDADRQRFGNMTIPMGVSARKVVGVLHGGQIVAMLADQSASKESVFVDFFGRPAATHGGPAAFSLKTGAPIVMGFLTRTPEGTYVIMFEEVPQTDLRGYTEENIVELTRRHTAILEKHIRLRPDHWLWMHRRWKHTEYYRSLQPVEEEA